MQGFGSEDSPIDEVVKNAPAAPLTTPPATLSKLSHMGYRALAGDR